MLCALQSWKHRYFVLWPKIAHPTLGRVLAYFTSDDATDPKGCECRGVVHLNNPVVRAPKTARPLYYCFRLNANKMLGTTAGKGAKLVPVVEPKKFICGLNDLSKSDEQNKEDIVEWVEAIRMCGPPAAAVDNANPTMEGWLFKQGTGLIRWWSRTWSQLHEGKLVHFYSENKPPGVFNLEHYYIYCPDSEERAREFEIALLPRPFSQTRSPSAAELESQRTAHFFR